MHSPPVVSSRSAPSRRWTVLAVVCASVYVINLDLTIVNSALPSLVREMGATTRQLQWIVDGYNLTFAAFVLAAGSLSDRYGRRGALMVGLGLFGVASPLGSLASGPTGLTIARGAMGVGAAVIFPTTLSIIANAFPDRRERSRAIGVWGAVTGIGVATGPLAGGWLLERFWWGSVFLAMAPVAALAIVLTWRFVPTSKDPAVPPLDRPGLLLSTATIGTLVYTIIEAPERGWAAGATLTGFALAGVLLAVFVAWEGRREHPMLDVRLFSNLRFSAACAAVTVAWFSLFGFIFLITQYFQFLKTWAPLRAGVSYGPVAASIALGSVAGVLLAVRIGNKVVVASGLACMGLFFLWVSRLSTATPYWPEIVGQMVLIGTGLGLTTAPATEAIMGVVPKEKAGVGSAVNDATRELGGTLGVAIIGSLFASAYARAMDSTGALAGLPGAAAHAARDSVGGAFVVADQLSRQAGPAVAARLSAAADYAFFRGLTTACLVAGVIALAGAAFAAVVLPARPLRTADDARTSPAPPAARPGPPAERAVAGTGAAAAGRFQKSAARFMPGPPPLAQSPSGGRVQHTERGMAVPMVEIIHPEGAFTAEAKKSLLESLSETCLFWEGIEVTEVTQSIAWVYLDERPRDSIAVGGHPLTQNVYRVNVSVMVGFMDYERIEGMVKEITDAVLKADGTAGTGEARVYVIVNEVPSGTWGVDGKVWPTVFTAEAISIDPERVKRMAAAIESRPRLDVPIK